MNNRKCNHSNNSFQGNIFSLYLERNELEKLECAKATYLSPLVTFPSFPSFPYLSLPCDKFEPLFLSESSLSGQNMSLRGWPLVANLSNVRPVSVQVLKKQKMPV